MRKFLLDKKNHLKSELSQLKNRKLDKDKDYIKIYSLTEQINLLNVIIHKLNEIEENDS